MATQNSDSIVTLAVVADTTADEEQTLLRRLAQGDTTAFWGLWEQYKNTLLSQYCLQWMGNNQEDAEDALSSASLRAWQYLSTHTHEITNIKAWLTRLLYNHCMSMHKARQQRLQYVQPVENTDSVTDVSSASAQPSTEDAMLLREMRMYIRSSINVLPPQLRELVILDSFQEMPQWEIATYLNISPENVRKRLQHARDLLRRQIAPYLRGENGPAWEESKSDIPSTALLASVRDVASHVPQAHETITSQVVAMRTVQITLPDGVERHVHLALDHKPTRQHQKVQTLRAYVQQHPTGWRKRVQLAHLLYTMGHWEEAIAAYRQVLQRQPRSLDVQLRLGQLLHLLHRDDEAITVYQDTLALTGKRATQYYLEGCIAACRQHLEEAVQSFTAAAALEPCNIAHWQALGLTRLHAGQPVEALQAFETALEVNPDDLVALTYSYSPLVAMGRDEEAQRRMERALQLDSRHVLALTRLAYCFSRMRWVRGEVGSQTRALLRRAMRVAAGNPKVQASFAYYHIARGEWNSGLALLRKFTAEHPYCPDGWYHYARWCFRTGASQSAAEAIMQAHALDQNNAAIYQVACDLLPSVGKHEDVGFLLEEMLQRFPSHWSVWATAGRVLVEKFRDKGYACSISAHAPMLQPDLPQAWLRHGRVLALAGKHQEAAAVLEQGWQLLSDKEGNTFAAQAAEWLGESYHALGERAKSQAWWKIVIQRASSLSILDPAMGYYSQGKAWVALGQRTKAWQAYRMALRHHLRHPACFEVKQILQGSHIPPLPVLAYKPTDNTDMTYTRNGR